MTLDQYIAILGLDGVNDLINIVLYLKVNKFSPKINIYDIDQSKANYFSNLSKYYKNKFFLNTKIF